VLSGLNDYELATSVEAALRDERKGNTELHRLGKMLMAAETPEERYTLAQQMAALADPDGTPFERCVWLAGQMTREQLEQAIETLEAIREGTV